MAHLLGSEYCLESLQSDVRDLQSAVLDVTSRVGPVRYPSWKFPDKISSDLDIPALLEEHSFSEDEEDNQVAHIVLFELVIDRMLLLLQGFARFAETLLAGTQGRPPTAGLLVGSQMSVGLVVKKFWNKMVQLSNLCAQLQAENKAKSKTVSKLEVINTELQLQSFETSKKLNSTSDGKSGPNSGPVAGKAGPSKGYGGMLPPPCSGPANSPPAERGTIAADTRTIASQTVETAFVPCEACSVVQLTLGRVAEAITEVCRSQGLPSALADHRQRLGEAGGPMAAADVDRWSAQQAKDLDRIRGCLADLLAQVQPLTADLSAAEAECAGLRSAVGDKTQELRREREGRAGELRQHQARLKEAERQHAQSVLVVKRCLDEAERGRRTAQEELLALKRELQRQCEARQALEDINARLTLEAEGNTANRAGLVRLESQVQELSRQLQDAGETLQATSKELGKEQARNRSVQKHGQAMQTKHDTLARRVDELDQECSDLRDLLAASEEEQEQLTEQLEETQREVKQLKEELKTEKDLLASVREEKQFLEQSIGDLQTMIVTLEAQLSDAQSRERMLVQYPDMNPGLLPQGPAPTGEGDNPSDMQEQVRSNNIRMQILEEQNGLLRKNIAKMLAQQNGPSPVAKVTGPAIPLWQSSGAPAADRARGPGKESRSRQQGDLGMSHQAQSRGPYSDAYGEADPSRKGVDRARPSRKASPRGNDATGPGIPPLPGKQAHGEARDAGRTTAAKQGGRWAGSGSPNVAKLSTTGGNTSLNAYQKLKHSGAIGAGDKTTAKGRDGRASANGRPSLKQGWVHTERPKGGQGPEDHQYTPLSTFVCPSCDKMYTTEQDLEIHQSYCYG